MPYSSPKLSDNAAASSRSGGGGGAGPSGVSGGASAGGSSRAGGGGGGGGSKDPEYEVLPGESKDGKVRILIFEMQQKCENVQYFRSIASIYDLLCQSLIHSLRPPC